MAREQRKDVDYFPHQCVHGRKMHIIESKYGNDGYAAWFKLLEQLGKANNHFIDITDEFTFLFLVSTFRVDENTTREILSDLAKLGAIDKFLYEEHNIIFSQKFSDSVQDAYRKRKNPIYQYSDILKEKGIKIGQSSAGLPEVIHKEEANTAEVTLKEKDSKEEKSKEEDICEDDLIDIWKRARQHFDNKPTGIDKLLPAERMCFNNLIKEGYKKEDFEFAVAGLFFQNTLPAVRVRPDWLLRPENFTKMHDCWKNKSKMFADDKNGGKNQSQNTDHLKREKF
ncbi:DUF4373 domain-containing protein [Flavobacterium sp. 25HG05S-40]|uniref:DUF4373 domain-containing protein n=1 Tax=Flavobacterium sp. 25HG05S-40 TaxID=3458682 RepID=UPI0040446AA4